MKIVEFFSERSECSYLKNKESFFRYFYIEECSEYFYAGLLARGWRRFGECFFVPVCQSCDACKTIRQNIAQFIPSRIHRRIIRKNQDLEVILQKPSFSEEKLQLYNKYHRVMEEKKQWHYKSVDERYYYDTFVAGGRNFGYELNYFLDGILLGVGYVDILEDLISAIYFFYDHDFEKRSLGVFNILTQFHIARQRGIPYFYPGYWIEGHPSLGYKSKFKPFEILCNQPDLFDVPDYKPFRSIDDQ
ncbi:arginyltransferase [Helicobacter mustelae]|uniref:Aspartate/glutamate leucyltransferase n=1 Tax=Helicobacter mustelae (strain ATCC 43772 / CCUG 25715 / CIP 103759 / LMG 18044 / NCTC 12198 / R85-136P) TaxID=679897 RepID=D3UJ04_HELM1|nr:arginyltransferase [Helicobacter mustelae]CBG40479.1 putative arginyl-tRNA-protein transferase, Ate [Helicobacter mustelae 12198]SQH71978.1 arginyl-tRNA-protein transferase [Helicobacter mustelae]STP13121.1 arginyl-tRNA-protein transferase [Helicobacter mustelae]